MNASSEWDDLSGELDGMRISHRARAGDIPVLLVHGIGQVRRGGRISRR